MISLLKEVGRGKRGARDLTYEEARQAAELIVGGEATPAQIGAFLVAERIKMESLEELRAFIDVLRAWTRLHPVPGSFDCAGPYDGRTRTFMATLPTAFVLAACGMPATLHGSAAMPPKWGVTLPDVLKELTGIAVDKSTRNGTNTGVGADADAGARSATDASAVDDANAGVRNGADAGAVGGAGVGGDTGSGIDAARGAEARFGADPLLSASDASGFLFVPSEVWCPPLARLRGIREELGLRTVFNTAEKLLRYSDSTYMAAGVFHGTVFEKVAKLVMDIGVKRGLIVQGMEGSEDIGVDKRTRTYLIQDGASDLFVVDPEQFGLQVEVPEGDWTAARQAKTAAAVLGGEAELPYMNMVLLNSAVRLWIGEKAGSIEEGVYAARAALDEGRALAAFERWKAALVGSAE
jgi:anthranilate phosphoribosyltransferase